MVELDLPVPGTRRGRWGQAMNANFLALAGAIDEFAAAVDDLPDTVGAEVTNQLAILGVTPAPDLVDRLKASTAPIIVGHRGGARIHPEHTLEGYRDCFRSGFLPETDVRKLATGELVCIHDATTTRTMSGATATVSAMTLAQWKSRQVNSPWPGGKAASPAMWEDVLAEFGGQVVIVAEIKDAAATQDVIDSIVARGLHRQVIVQSFTLDVVQQTAAAGIASMLLTSTTTTTTPTELVNSGIEFLGPGQSMSAPDIAAFRAAGIKVVPYTVGTPADWTALQAKSVDGAFFDDPWGATGYFPRCPRDPYSSAAPWYGWDYWSSAGDTTPAINYQTSQGALWMNGMSSAGSKSMRQSWAPALSPVAGTSVLRFRARLGFDSGGGPNTGTTARWAGVFLGATADGVAYQDAAAAGQSGYHFLFRRSGTLDVYRVDPGVAAVNIGTAALTPALSNADRVDFVEVEIILNGTGIRVRRLDTGGSVNVTDGTYRTNLGLHLTCNGTNALWRDVSYDLLTPVQVGY
ncbi:glycerophosphodiester phosphodiesterase [Isoptericola sp. NPDC055881]